MNKEVTMNLWAVSSLKLAVASFVIFLLKVWPAAMNWVHSVNVWWFIVAAIIFSIKPLMIGCSCNAPVQKKKKK
jgi:hypothetical protein